jgi:hypothetical protein
MYSLGDALTLFIILVLLFCSGSSRRPTDNINKKDDE